MVYLLGIAFVATRFGRGPSILASCLGVATLEFFFVQLQVAAFGAGFLAFPVIAGQIYKFVAPGLYRNERQAFLPFLVAPPIQICPSASVTDTRPARPSRVPCAAT